MSRIASGDVVYVKPSNNVYTALAAVGMIVTLAGLVLFYRAANTALGGSLF